MEKGERKWMKDVSGVEESRADPSNTETTQQRQQRREKPGAAEV